MSISDFILTTVIQIFSTFSYQKKKKQIEFSREKERNKKGF